MIGSARVRIVIDYRPALRARTGVGEHIHQVDQRARANRQRRDYGVLELVEGSSAASASRPSCPASGSSICASRSRALNLAWHRLRWPPIEALAGGEYDIAHSPHPLLLPSRSAAQIVTIHDLHFLSHPERTSAEIRRDYPALVRAHAHRADRIIVVSRFVAGEVQRLLGIAADRISVCPNGAPEWKEPAAAAGCGRLPAVRRHDRATQECRRAARGVRAAARAPRRRSATGHRRPRRT